MQIDRKWPFFHRSTMHALIIYDTVGDDVIYIFFVYDTAEKLIVIDMHGINDNNELDWS